MVGWRSLPEAASHRQTRPSIPAEATVLPSGEKVPGGDGQDVTAEDQLFFNAAGSQSTTLPSVPAEASVLPSAAKARPNR